MKEKILVSAFFQAGQDGHLFGDDLVDVARIEHIEHVALDAAPILVHRVTRIHFLSP